MDLLKKTACLIKFFSCLIILHATITSAAVLPEPSTESVYPNWSIILEEGNLDSFYNGLDHVYKCLKDEKENTQLNQDSSIPTDCQKQANHFISHKNNNGDNLLKQFLLFDNLDDSQLINIFQRLEYIGVDIYGLEFLEGDSALFHAMEKQSIYFMIYLFSDVVKKDPRNKKLLYKMKSADGISLANLLIEKFPENLTVLNIIMTYNLVSDPSELTNKNSMVYKILKESHTEL